MGTLYIVATPIGNLDDVTKRAIDTLKSVELVLAEDTRVVQKLLSHFEIKKEVESYHQHTVEDKKLFILKQLMDGKDIALVSDAGTPGISDPGNELIDFLYENIALKVIPIPGASAVSTALSVCGFDVSKHLFLGFWPKKKTKKTIDLIKLANVPFVYFDSPHRIIKNLAKLAEELGNRRVFIGRELTKMHETHYRGNIEDIIKDLQGEKHLKGEVVVVVE